MHSDWKSISEKDKKKYEGKRNFYKKKSLIDKNLKLEKRLCPVCFSKKYSKFYKNNNYSKINTNGSIYRYKHILVICKNCNLVYSNPWLGHKNTKKLYSSSAIGSAFEQSEKAKNILNALNLFSQKKLFQKKYKYLRNWSSNRIITKKY